jgi:hypothetical protein
MSGGGGSQTQTSKTQSDPWAAAQPYLTDALSRLSSAYGKAPSYYGGPLTIGATDAEKSAWDTLKGFNSQYFGKGGQYDQATGANDTLLSGGPAAGYAAGMAPGTLKGLNDLSTVGPYQLHQLGTAGNLDATGAINAALSGTPDYSGLADATTAANAPLLRQFNNEILPGLNSKATFLNNSTGGIKSLGTIVPDLAQRMSENALGLTNQERLRALASRDAAAGLVTQGGLQQDSQGQNALDSWGQQRLGLGSLLGQYSGQASSNMNAGIGNSSGLYNLGQMPGNTDLAYANWDRGLKTDANNAEWQKFNYLRDAPMDWASKFAASVLPFAGVGGTTSGTQTTSQKNHLGLGDAILGGAGLGSIALGSGAGSGGGKGGGSSGGGKGGGRTAEMIGLPAESP